MVEMIKKVKRTWYVPYHWCYGKAQTFFFQKMKEEKKIYGARCSKCGKVVVPVAIFCTRCFAPTDDWVQVEDEGVIHSFTIVNLPYPGQPATPPYAYALIKLNGSDNLFMHMIGGVEHEKIEIHMKVKAVWSEERNGDFYDIQYFEPVSK